MVINYCSELLTTDIFDILTETVFNFFLFDINKHLVLFVCITGDKEIPSGIFRIYEHCVTTRAHPIQPSDQSCPLNTDQPTEGH